VRRSTTGCSERLVKPRRWPTSVNGYPHPACSLRPDFGTGTQLLEKTAGAVSSETISPAQEVGPVALRAGSSLARAAGTAPVKRRFRISSRATDSNGPAMRANAKARPLDGGQTGGRSNHRQRTYIPGALLVSDERQRTAGSDHEREASDSPASRIEPAKTETCPHALPPPPVRRAA
jgi:hypothetical protein